MKRMGLSKIGIFLLAIMLVTSVMTMNLTKLYAEDGGSGDAIEIPIDEEHFPDAHFRENCVRSYDGNKDGKLSKEEMEAVDKIGCERDTKSLKGIEYFTKLKTLHCGDSQITNLDVSKNINLEYLSCRNNQLETLDVSKNPNLRYLACYKNQLKTLDVSKNINLEVLDCYENQLKTLRVRGASNLTNLHCHDNQLTELDLRDLPNLLSLDCYGNQLGELDLSNKPKLLSLNCVGNQLTALDLTNNPELDFVETAGNKLKFIKLNSRLTTLVKKTKVEKIAIGDTDWVDVKDQFGLPDFMHAYEKVDVLAHDALAHDALVLDILMLSVKFDVNGHGVAPAKQSFETDVAVLDAGVDELKVTKPEDPTEEGWIFGGWYTDKGCTEGKEFNFDTLIKEDTTLYAKWTKEGSESVADGEENKADTDKKEENKADADKKVGKKNDTGAKKQFVRKATPVMEDTTNIFAIILLGIASLVGIVGSLGLGNRRENR